MESNKPEKTCEQRIDKQLERRLREIRENPEEAQETLLSVEKSLTFKLCLSWGGPADYFELDWCPESKAWIGARYLFKDWFDGASREMSVEVAEAIADLFGLYPEAG